jgi:hypothetical protein
VNEVKLYRKNAIGIGTWRIWVRALHSDRADLVYAHAVTEGASEILHSSEVVLNGSGRNVEQQVQLEINSRISRMRDKGYKDSREEAMLGSTNQMGLLNPMLAMKLEDVRPSFVEAHVQPKFDGHRCLITNVDGHIVPYSRKGKPITTIGHIMQDFHWLPPGKTVDGELYIHGVKLQTISSLIKRQQDDSSKLRYHWYDYVSALPFRDRLAGMESAAFRYPMRHSEVVPTFKVVSMAQVHNLFHTYRAQGYEGAMLRLSVAGYEANKRSSQLLKVKVRDDCEVTVLGAVPARDGSAVLNVRMDNGKVFDLLAPGPIHEKRKIMDEITSHVGRRLTIEYAMLTNDGIPFHAVATRWHEEL